MEPRPADSVAEQVASVGYRSKLLLLVALLLTMGAFVFASRTFRVPVSPRFDGSLLAQPSPFVSLAIVAVTMLAGVLISTLIAGTIRFDAGLFCATLGMVALSIRCGRMGD